MEGMNSSKPYKISSKLYDRPREVGPEIPTWVTMIIETNCCCQNEKHGKKTRSLAPLAGYTPTLRAKWVDETTRPILSFVKYVGIKS